MVRCKDLLRSKTFWKLYCNLGGDVWFMVDSARKTKELKQQVKDIFERR